MKKLLKTTKASWTSSQSKKSKERTKKENGPDNMREPWGYTTGSTQQRQDWIKNAKAKKKVLKKNAAGRENKRDI